MEVKRFLFHQTLIFQKNIIRLCFGFFVARIFEKVTLSRI